MPPTPPTKRPTITALTTRTIPVTAAALAALAAFLYFEWAGIRLILDGHIIYGSLITALVALIGAILLRLGIAARRHLEQTTRR